MDRNAVTQYYYLIRLFLLLALSCIAGELVESGAHLSPIHDPPRHQVASLLLANGYVPIIISKPAASVDRAAPRTGDNASNHLTASSADSRKDSSFTAISSRNVTDKVVPLFGRMAGTTIASPARNLLTKQSNSQVIASKLSPEIQAPGSAFNVLDVMASLDTRLKHIRNIELGVTYIQEIFDAMGYSKAQTNEEAIVQIATKLRTKLEAVDDILHKLSEFIGSNVTFIVRQQRSSNASGHPNVFLNTLIQPCPFDDFTLEQNYNKKQIQILNYLKISGSRKEDDLNFTINSHIGNALRKTSASSFSSTSFESSTASSSSTEGSVPAGVGADASPHTTQSNFKHVYFLSRNDHSSDHNCQYYFNDLNFRQLYVSAVRHKHVFLAIDYGNSLTSEQLDLSKQFVANIIQMLSDQDTISIVLVNEKAEAIRLAPWDGPSPEHTFEQNLRYNTTMDRKEELLRKVAMLSPSKHTTNHSLAFQYSFELLRKQDISNDTPLTFVYVTRGLLNRFTEAMTVLDTVAKGQSLLRKPIVINTCAVILDEKRIMYEKQFLHDIAQQNYSKYNINVSSWHDTDNGKLRGSMFVITKRHPELIIKTSTSIFGSLFKPKYVSSDTQYHLPISDYNTKDIIVPITKPIPLYGVAGINMYLDDLAEDIIYYHRTDDSYPFLVDTNGMVIYHPAYTRPVATTKTPYPVQIGLLEMELSEDKSGTGKDNLWRVIATQPTGNISTVRSAGADGSDKKIKYVWHRILDAYIVCLVTIEKFDDDERPLQWKTRSGTRLSSVNTDIHPFDRYQDHVELTPSSDLLYHRIDLIPPPKTPVCRHFRQIATLDTGTIFLSASAFKSPFVFFKNNREVKDETQRTHNAQSIMAYIKDITNLLANPGLQVQIRSDVSALLHVMAYLKKRHLENSTLKKYIIRRYVATKSGVLQVYPGCILGADLEPSRRPWFRKAVRHPGRTTITEPYLDAGGAGYIITIAHTIFEGKANALHNAEKDLPIAVVALDVPYAFFYKLLLEMSPICSELKIKCLLMEDQGYLLAHPSMMEPATPTMNSRRPLEHITHKESFVANDILNHKVLVKKKACATFQSRIIQRYYEFNISLAQVLTNNVVHGERTKYQITAVPGTNIFAAILNSTCDGGAFCPCSTVDRICLNCNRMDQADCECPCECPLKMNTRFLDFSLRNTSLDYCEPETEGLAVVNSLSYDWSLVVKSCVNINCELYTTHMECLGVMGCEWCQLDVDMNPFAAPFCTAQNSCFNGFLGSATPYGEGDLGSAIVEPATAPAYSAIGPVGGTIIALCLMVGFAMYCYRQNLDSGSEHLYGSDSMQEDNYGVPLSRLYFDDALPRDDNDLNGNGGVGGGNMMHRNLLHPLTNALVVNEISPYHMSPGGYRRPANGESDHGYSTMTPHEDSEHMCFTLVEPLISNHKQLSLSADSMSISTSVSSPTSQPNHHIPPSNMIAPTVHDYSSKNHAYVGGTMTTTQPNQMFKFDTERGSSILPDCLVPGQTILPNITSIESNASHHILAPVTVHRHMEAS